MAKLTRTTTTIILKEITPWNLKIKIITQTCPIITIPQMGSWLVIL
jgi:hypothetical protein